MRGRGLFCVQGVAALEDSWATVPRNLFIAGDVGANHPKTIDLRITGYRNAIQNPLHEWCSPHFAFNSISAIFSFTYPSVFGTLYD